MLSFLGGQWPYFFCILLFCIVYLQNNQELGASGPNTKYFYGEPCPHKVLLLTRMSSSGKAPGSYIYILIFVHQPKDTQVTLNACSQEEEL